MASVNSAVLVEPVYTHEGARAALHDKPREQLWRTIGATLLWEPQFYESGDSIAKRITRLVGEVADDQVAELTVLARTRLKLRHVPLWMAASLAFKHRSGRPAPRVLSNLLPEVIRRPDELAEFLAMYWRLNGRTVQTPGKATPNKRLSTQVKVGLASAFRRFNEYQLAKWARDEQVRLRDVLFLCHAKPRDQAQADLWKRLVDRKLATPDTWEVALSAGKNAKETWQRLIDERKLGYIALLMNLRNALQAGVDEQFLRDAIVAGARGSMALPFRFISAARAAPKLEGALSEALMLAAEDLPKLPGRSLLVIDVSGSMQGPLGGKSKLRRLEAAGALAVTTKAMCERSAIYATAGNDSTRVHKTKELPDRAGLGMIDALSIASSELGGGGIFLKQCMDYIAGMELARPFDRVLVFTDEQDCDVKANPSTARKLAPNNYIMNVASYEHGIATDSGWERISGFSDGVLSWLSFNETGNAL